MIITFEDGTVITVGYGKEDKAIWWIKVSTCGLAGHALIPCDDEDAEIYSDVLEIEAEAVLWKLAEERQ